MNNVCLVGRLANEPELKTTQSGVSFTRFDIAVDNKYSKDKEKKADFITIVAWSGTAEFICKYFSKGQRIGITGRIQTGVYTDKDGNKRKTFDVLANDVEFVERKQGSYVQTSQIAELPLEEDLPF